MGHFSVPACANQPLGFSVRGKSTTDRLFQTISGLKIISGSQYIYIVPFVPFKNRKS